MQNESIEVLGEITEIEIIAVGNSIRDLDRLQKKHGRGVVGEN
jgi:acid stress-induced BolA-like protein IbaG/YrbA